MYILCYTAVVTDKPPQPRAMPFYLENLTSEVSDGHSTGYIQLADDESKPLVRGNPGQLNSLPDGAFSRGMLLIYTSYYIIVYRYYHFD